MDPNTFGGFKAVLSFRIKTELPCLPPERKPSCRSFLQPSMKPGPPQADPRSWHDLPNRPWRGRLTVQRRVVTNPERRHLAFIIIAGRAGWKPALRTTLRRTAKRRVAHTRYAKDDPFRVGAWGGTIRGRRYACPRLL